MDPRAGTLALASDLVNVDALLSAYYDLKPDPDNAAHQVVFGTSGHRGSSLDTAFNEEHIVAMTAAIVEYRARHSTDGPLFLGRDTHALSHPAWQTALEVLAAHGVTVMIDARDSYTPTPAVSQSILLHNGAITADGVRTTGPGLADGIVITPSHNPPRDGGFKYNPPHGGPAGSEATAWIADRANDIIRGGIDQVRRVSLANALHADTTHRHDYLSAYLDDLGSVIDLDVIRAAGVRIGADPLGGASVEYWGELAERLDLDVTVINPTVDPQWGFMTLDWDAKIRMDCSSPYAMASLVAAMSSPSAAFDIATGNDADADRHGIVTPDGGLMNPNHFLAVAIDYLMRTGRPQWSPKAAIGKTLVSSALIDRVGAGLGRRVLEVPVGFKWFVPGLLNGSVAFGGEESAGASFLRRDGRVWSTDKDGILLALLAAEILAATGQTPSHYHRDLVSQYGQSWYARVDAPATMAQKKALSQLSADQVTSTHVAGEVITATLTSAPGNNEALGGLKVTTPNAWFAARPSGTENVYKIYAESFISEEHLTQVQTEAREVVTRALAG